MLSNGKGFYLTLAYTLECRRLGVGFLPPDVNTSRWNFTPEGNAIRVSLRVVKDLTTTTLERYRNERRRAPFTSLRDFFQRTGPTASGPPSAGIRWINSPASRGTHIAPSLHWTNFQTIGDRMKLITICNRTGIIECDLFADTYRRFWDSDRPLTLRGD